MEKIDAPSTTIDRKLDANKAQSQAPTAKMVNACEPEFSKKKFAMRGHRDHAAQDPTHFNLKEQPAASAQELERTGKSFRLANILKTSKNTLRSVKWRSSGLSEKFKALGGVARSKTTKNANYRGHDV